MREHRGDEENGHHLLYRPLLRLRSGPGWPIRNLLGFLGELKTALSDWFHVPSYSGPAAPGTLKLTG